MQLNGPDESGYAHLAQFRREFVESLRRAYELTPWEERFITNSMTGHYEPVIDRTPRGRQGPRPTFELVDELREFDANPANWETNVREPKREEPLHEFAQDPDFETSVCEECGMWPLYHTHFSASGCNCATCDPEGYRWENMCSTVLPGYGDEQYDTSEYGGKPDTFRPHP